MVTVKMDENGRTELPSQALEGLRVIEFGDMVSAAYSTKLMADLGADVIKAEWPGVGDESRKYGPFPGDEPDQEKSGLFLYLNMNKKGITLDLRSSTGRRVLRELVKVSDVLVHNHSTPLADELGLRYSELRELNPGLIMLSLSPYGLTGPYKDYKGYEINTASLGGVVMQLGLPGRAPLNPPQFLGHYQAALTGAMALMIAVVVRDLTGKGQHIDLAEADSWATFHTGTGIVQWLFGLRTVMRHGRRVRGGPYPNTIIPCKDGEIRLQAMTKREWNRILDMMGNPEWGKDPRFQDRLQMNELYADELDELIGAWLKKHTKQELFQKFYEFGVPFTPVYDIADFVNDSHLEARGFFHESNHPKAGVLKYPGKPYNLSQTPWTVRCPAPLLGQHNVDVYQGLLGYENQEIFRLRMASVV